MNHVFCLQKPAEEDAAEFSEMMRLWHLTRGRINPKLLRFYHGDYIRWLDIIERHSKGMIRGSELPQILYFLKHDGVLVGAISIRDKIRHDEVKGHISYGIHPAYRRKGFGKMALTLALKMIREEFGMTSARVICDADNHFSKKIIEGCGGVFVRHTYKKNVLTDVYDFDMEKFSKF